MRTSDFVEKRRSQRLDLSLPANIRYASGNGDERALKGVTIDVSFNGAYLTDINISNIKPEDSIKISISVPRDDARDFPFSRLTGKAKVVRVDKDGMAIDFDEDISRLFVAN
ncbi:MAG TPA: PilZ domain-containing protein [Candidatus Omnitrophica bacterium]|nr:PilZ domain-containing protein [Candidatus Omnitrophota bacterium]